MYEIKINEYGGLSWTIDITNMEITDLIKFIQEITLVKYKFIDKKQYLTKINKKIIKVKKNDIKYFNVIEKFKGIRNCFNEIKNMILDKSELITIKSESVELRLCLSLMCKILGFYYEILMEKTINTMYCGDFITQYHHPSLQYTYRRCGCKNVPQRIRKYWSGNTYDDDEAIFKVPWCNKIGIVIYNK
jgi:uncharacterized protein YktA (UPF0223 family)